MTSRELFACALRILGACLFVGGGRYVLNTEGILGWLVRPSDSAFPRPELTSLAAVIAYWLAPAFVVWAGLILLVFAPQIAGALYRHRPGEPQPPVTWAIASADLHRAGFRLAACYLVLVGIRTVMPSPDGWELLSFVLLLWHLVAATALWFVMPGFYGKAAPPEPHAATPGTDV